MDSGRQTNKGSARKSTAQPNDVASLQQQMALAAQLGMVPGLFDPTALATGANLSDVEMQRLLSIQAGSMPFVDPAAAMHAFSGIGGLPLAGMPSSLMMPGNMAAGNNEWLAMAQQAQLLSGLGGSVPPQFLSQLYGSNSLPSTTNVSGESSKSNEISVKKEAIPLPPTPRSPGQNVQVSKVSSRPSSNASSSRLTPSGVWSPGPSNAGRPSSKPRPQTSTPNSVPKETKFFDNTDKRLKKSANADQMLQAEMLRQFEQQFLLQQMQIKQQEQLEATMKAMNLPNLQSQQRGATKNRPSNNSQSDKLQEHISQSIYQQLLSSNPFLPGVPPGMNSYFATQQILDQMMNLGQSSNNVKEKSSRGKYFPSTSGNSSSSASRDNEKQVQGSRSSNQNTASSKRGTFSSKVPEVANPFFFTGDPNTDLYIAALYGQLQGQDGSAAKVEKNNKSAPRKSRESPTDKKALINSISALQQQYGAKISSSKDASNFQSQESISHRRKQANPVSISNMADPPTDTQARANSRDGGGHKPLSDSGGSLQLSTSNHTETTKIPTEKISSSAKNHFLDSNDDVRSKQSSSMSDSKPEVDLNEKDIILAMQAMAKNSNKSESSSSTDQVDQLLASVCDKFLKSGESFDINKMNEILTATVAAEMKRLQVQKVNLTRELEMLNKNGNPVKQASAPGGNDRNFSSGSQQDVKYPRKRRRIISDEDEVMEPLRQGWKREIKCRKVGNQVRGEVFYHTPEGKKLRTYSDVLKYLEYRSIDTLHRNNFSFSSRLKIGTFYEQKGDSKQWTEIPEAEIDRHLGSFEHDDSSQSASASDDNQPSANSRRKRNAKTAPNNTSFQQVIEDKLRMNEENEADKLAEAELKMQQREQKKLAKLQREIKERQLLEERRKLEAARQLVKYQEAIRKEKEREERRRQLEFMKIMETKRRAEERDRRKEEIKNERIFIREKKMQQRRLAMRLARELKMPVEDMCLNSLQPLPKMQSLQRCHEGDVTQLNGESTADVLMVLEFLLTFKDALSIDDDVIPSFEQLQRGLLNDAIHVEALVKLTMALLHQCLCDPGVPAPGPWLHCSIGVKVTDLDVTKENYSEILRLFLWARNGGKTEITDLLETEPFPSLSADNKAAVLASLVNELVCSKPVCEEIDKHLDNLATLRRDKWIVEGKIRQARIEHANDGSDSASVNSPLKPRSKQKQRSEDDEDDKDDKLEKEDSSKDDDSVASDNKPTCRSDTLMERKMKILTKEHQSFNDRLYSSSKPLRSLEMGQDRYRRRYWVLSHLGGIYVEGLESGGWYDNEDNPEEDTPDKANLNEENNDSTNTDIKDEPLHSSIPNFVPSNQQSHIPDSIPISRDIVVTNVTSCKTFPTPAFTVSNHVTRPVTSYTTDPCDLTKRAGASPQNLSLQTDDVTSTCANDTVTGGMRITEHVDTSASTSSLHHPVNHSTESDQVQDLALLVNRDQINSLPASPLTVNSQVKPTTVDRSKSSQRDVYCMTPSGEDKVEAAAKAIAAKAVAASSHLLYPQMKSSNKLPPALNSDRIDLELNTKVKSKDEISAASSVIGHGSIQGLGKHITDTLLSLGRSMDNLSDQQIETLVTANKTTSTSPHHLSMNRTVTSPTTSTATIDSTTPLNSSLLLPSEDAPIDLSKPSTHLPPNPNSFNPPDASLMRPIKTEPLSLESGFSMTSPTYFGLSMTSHMNSMIKSEAASPEVQEVKANDVCKTAAPIPEEMKLGWWRVSSEEEFEELCNTLHCRGIREKHLHRSATKHRNYCLQAIRQAREPEFQFFVNSTNKENKRNSTDSKDEDKTDDKDDDEDDETVSSQLLPEKSSKTAFHVEIELIEQAEDLIDRCVAAGLLKENAEAFSKLSEHRDRLSHAPYHYDDDEVARHDWFNPIEHDEKSALGFAVELVRKLEESLLRSFLKPPLVRKGGSSEFSNLPSLSESGALDVAAGLKTWRNAVATATSASQLSMCVTMLDSCINWQRAPNAMAKIESSPKSKKKRPGGKSPGSSSAKKKKKIVESVAVDSEDSMSSSRLVVDCADEILKVSEPDMRIGDNSTNASYSSLPGQDESSIMQVDDQSENSDKEATSNTFGHLNLSAEEKSTAQTEEEQKVKKKKKKKNKDDKPKKKKSLSGICKEILRNLQAHEKAAWFLFPVDIKAVPDYRKFIKNPMDFKTIENRLKRKKYKMASQFAEDVRTVFDNCQIFNEDDSPIGEAGHALRAVFEDKWSQVESSMDLQDPIG